VPYDSYEARGADLRRRGTRARRRVRGLFPQWFGPAAGLITVVGLSRHAFGMWDKHRLEALGHTHNPSWVVALYWVCWLLLAAVLTLLLFWSR
jgi:hypothetical protein